MTPEATEKPSRRAGQSLPPSWEMAHYTLMEQLLHFRARSPGGFRLNLAFPQACEGLLGHKATWIAVIFPAHKIKGGEFASLVVKASFAPL